MWTWNFSPNEILDPGKHCMYIIWLGVGEEVERMRIEFKKNLAPGETWPLIKSIYSIEALLKSLLRQWKFAAQLFKFAKW